MPAIRAEALSKRFGAATAVDSVDLEVASGECWGLLGPNGAGKTTLLRMIVGKTPPSEGRLEVLGHQIPADARRMRQRIGVVPQLDNLDPDFTVRDNLRTYAGFFGIGGQALDARIVGLLEFASLAAKAGDRIQSLSGGMQRRLSMVRALVNDPELLILDEPTTGLDPQARQLIWQRLRELRARGMTIVLTTHYMEEAQRLCDRVTIMDSGRTLETDSPRGLIRRHIEPQVIEVHGQDLESWHLASGANLTERSEQVGETMFYYAHDETTLLAELKAHPQLTYLHRPANLEDVFVKLTGRELQEGQ
jgi:lipooligosaccharide transport system ATP-binding protein